MRWGTRLLLLLALAAGLTVLGRWVLHHPVFAIQRIELELNSLKIEISPPAPDMISTKQPSKGIEIQKLLAGKNIFTINVDALHDAWEEEKFFRKVHIQRIFPNTLRMSFEGHIPIAWWGTDKTSLMVNNHGEIFNDKLSSYLEYFIDTENPLFSFSEPNFPFFVGAPDDAAEILKMYQRLVPILSPLQSPIRLLEHTVHGRWRVDLDNGIQLKLGIERMPDAADIMQSLQRLVSVLPNLLHQQRHGFDEIEYIDLRYANGYALKLRSGVTSFNSKKVAGLNGHKG